MRAFYSFNLSFYVYFSISMSTRLLISTFNLSVYILLIDLILLISFFKRAFYFEIRLFSPRRLFVSLVSRSVSFRSRSFCSFIVANYNLSLGWLAFTWLGWKLSASSILSDFLVSLSLEIPVCILLVLTKWLAACDCILRSLPFYPLSLCMISISYTAVILSCLSISFNSRVFYSMSLSCIRWSLSVNDPLVIDPLAELSFVKDLTVLRSWDSATETPDNLLCFSLYDSSSIVASYCSWILFLSIWITPCNF
jgi:hypothetical protein